MIAQSQQHVQGVGGIETAQGPNRFQLKIEIPGKLSRGTDNICHTTVFSQLCQRFQARDTQRCFRMHQQSGETVDRLFVTGTAQGFGNSDTDQKVTLFTVQNLVQQPVEGSLFAY